MTDTQAPHYQEPPKSGRGKKGWIIAAVIVGIGLLMGACVWSFVGAFQNLSEMSEKARQTVEVYHTEGFPAADDPVWSSAVPVESRDIREMTYYHKLGGAFKGADSASCSSNASYSTNALSGQFVSCVVPVRYEKTPANVTIRWRKEDELWKLVNYHIQLAEDPRVEEALAAEDTENETDAPGETDAAADDKPSEAETP